MNEGTIGGISVSLLRVQGSDSESCHLHSIPLPILASFFSPWHAPGRGRWAAIVAYPPGDGEMRYDSLHTSDSEPGIQ